MKYACYKLPIVIRFTDGSWGHIRLNPINEIFSEESAEFLFYEGASNPIKSGFAFLYEAQCCVGS